MSALALILVWLALLAVAWRWRPSQAMSPSAWVLLVAFGILGGWALWFQFFDPPRAAGFEFWKPTVIYWTLAAIMFLVPPLGGGYPAKIILGNYFVLANREWRWINRVFAILFTLLGGINLIAAGYASYKDWEGFKFSCMVFLLTVVLFRMMFVWLPLLTEVTVHLSRRVLSAWRYLSGLF